MEFLNLILTWVVALNLIIAGIGKLSNLGEFVNIVSKIVPLSNKIPYIIGICFPIIELIIGFMLIILDFKWGMWASLILFISFLIVNILSDFNDVEITCNCYGAILPGKLGKDAFFNNIILILFNIVVLFTPRFDMKLTDFNFIHLMLVTLSILSLTIASILTKLYKLRG